MRLKALVGAPDIADKMDAKSKNIKKFRCSEQPIFLSSEDSSVLFMKDYSN